MKKKFLIFCLSCMLAGCSVLKASNQPDKKNIDLFRIGTPRALLLAEFGSPLTVETDEKKRTCEIFAFVQGYSSASKSSRVAIHGLADLLTLGMWEVIGTPLEVLFEGDRVAYQVCYNKNNDIEEVILLTKKDGKGL